MCIGPQLELPDRFHQHRAPCFTDRLVNVEDVGARICGFDLVLASQVHNFRYARFLLTVNIAILRARVFRS